jgi:phosphopantothenoylcysteine decarboxylase/phosphopantothenate--cysteine ligase
MSLRGKKVLLGITGGIGACKAPLLIRALRREGAEVAVVMTDAATRFVTPLTIETLSGNPVGLDMFSLTGERAIGHIARSRWADLLLVAPATANWLAKAAHGIADDLLSTVTLSVRCPVLCAPAMNTSMWEHPAVQGNLALLRSRGTGVVPPGSGELACGEEGAGRLAEEADILSAADALLAGGESAPSLDLAGISLLVTAGPTREPLDPVRFLGNRSSGRMGYALAEAALSRGARVHLVTGPVALFPPAGAEVARVETAEEMGRAIAGALTDCDWLLMAAAVSDFRVREVSPDKIRRRAGDKGFAVELVPNPDLLVNASRDKGGRLFVGFAAETGDLEARAREKLTAKGLDLVVANDVTLPGAGFDAEENEGLVISRAGASTVLPRMGKRAMADRIIDVALAAWKKRPPRA